MFAPRGANANFSEERGPRSIAIRTYERGVEDETLACGTGVVASAIVFAAKQECFRTDRHPGPRRRHPAGRFQPRGRSEFQNVTLTGPADFVFDGEID